MLLQLLAPLGRAPSCMLVWLALLLDYFVHACLWAAVVGLLCRCAPHSASTRHVLWRLSLLGPLLTTTLAALGSSVSVRLVATPVPLLSSAIQERLDTVQGAAPSTLLAQTAQVFLAMLGLGLLRLTAGLVRMQRTLRGRTRVVDPELSRRFSALCARSARPDALLTQSEHTRGPMVVGRREVCIPTGMLEAFEAAEIDAVFAHELAHLERADGLWFPIIGLLQTVLWMQPLNHRLAARFRESAELAADDRAVELIGAPLALARALTRLAHIVQQPSRQLVLPAMAGHASVQRVRRLVAASMHAQTLRPGAARARRVGLLALSTFGVAVPMLQVSVGPGASARSDARFVAPAASAESYLAHDAEMDALAREAASLELSIARHAGQASAPSAELLALQQALRHVHATQGWLERRLLASWDARDSAARPAAPGAAVR